MTHEDTPARVIEPGRPSLLQQIAPLLDASPELRRILSGPGVTVDHLCVITWHLAAVSRLVGVANSVSLGPAMERFTTGLIGQSVPPPARSVPVQSLICAISAADPVCAAVYADIAREEHTLRWLHSDLAAALAVFQPEEYESLRAAIGNYVLVVHAAMIREKVAAAPRPVAIYCPCGGFREQFGELSELLTARGYSVFHFYSKVVGDAFEARANAFFMTSLSIANSEGIEVFIVPTVLEDLPARSIKVLLDHGSFAAFGPDYTTIQHTHATTMWPLFDYHIVPSDVKLEQFRQCGRFYGIEECTRLEHEISQPLKPNQDAERIVGRLLADGRRVAQTICAVPGGYPKLDGTVQRAANAGPPEKVITYAPTPNAGNSNKDHWLPFMSVNECGALIVQTLAANFLDYTIVFRPHPDDRREVVNRVVAAGSAHSNFTYDDGQRSPLEVYSETEILVSDFSSVAYTFAFATLRPVLFYSRNEDQLGELAMSDAFCRHRDQVGRIAVDPTQMVAEIHALIAEHAAFRDSIANLRDSGSYNAGRSAEYIADSFEHIYSGKPHPDWVYLHRTEIGSEHPVAS